MRFPPNPISSHKTYLPQPKIDATDRRQIEAQNEDKSHTTKATLDDIKRVHQKEKKKKEQNNIESYQAGVGSTGWVSRNWICQKIIPPLSY